MIPESGMGVRSIVIAPWLVVSLNLSALVTGTPALANIYVEPAKTVPFPTQGRTVPFPSQTNTVPWPVPASSVPWASSVYYAPRSEYGTNSLRNIDAYLADQCKRSGNRQYYCTGTQLNSSQLDWINSVGKVQLQQTHYRCGTDRWCSY